MFKLNKIFLMLGFLTGTLLLIGCASATSTSAPTAEVSLSTATPESPLPAATATPVVTITPTLTLTHTSTSTLTNTPTLAPSPTPNMVMPGNYYIGKCTNENLQNDVKIKFCVNDVRVDSKRHMFFEVSWTASNIPDPPGSIIKQSDKNDLHIYLIDNLGNRYDHSAGGGAAYRDTVLDNEELETGWFKFGSPPVGALKFDFHDDDQHIVIKGITLIPGFGYITYEQLSLDQYPLVIKYDKDKWNPTKAEDGTNMLTHKKIPSCTIQVKQPGEPEGKLKSQSSVGDIEYSIYGYFDESQNLYIREYVYESGLSGLNPTIKPFFYVTIPADASNQCIMAVSDVLARLGLQTP
jgi:hypothetical protein